LQSKAIEGPKQMIGQKFDHNSSFYNPDLMRNPGPGQYNPDFYKTFNNAPSYSLKSKTYG